MQSLASLLFLLLSFAVCSSVWGQQNASPRSLAAQKLSPASFPEEAEIFCSYEKCVFGLTRGFVAGGDAFGMIYAPLRSTFDPNWNSGSIYIIDAFAGYQILRNLDNKSFMNFQLGYRRISYDDGRSNEISTQGITTKINYSQIITPIYEQGLSFSGFFSQNSSLNNPQALQSSNPRHRDLTTAADYYYRVSQKYPVYRFSLPADLNVVTWMPAQTQLESPLRLYAHIEPFYIQNSLNFAYNDIFLNEREQNFGLRTAASLAYESVEGLHAGRYALLASLGFDLSSSTFSSVQSGDVNLDLPKRPIFSPYVNLAASWQF